MAAQAHSGFLASAPGERVPMGFDALPGLDQEDFLAAWPVFLASCREIVADTGRAASGLASLAREALQFSPGSSAEVRDWLAVRVTPQRILPHEFDGRVHPFVTGYFEPELDASRVARADFPEPARGRPHDLVDGPLVHEGETFSAARRQVDGSLTPYWTRVEIDAGHSAAAPLAWLRDAVDLFIAQVQGSARVRFDDGAVARLAYGGKNGRPYASIGKLLIEKGLLTSQEMSLQTLSATLRRLLNDPQAGRAFLHHNPSYVFFRLLEGVDPAHGPVGTQGVPLTPFRSLAVDRSIWPLGSLFWVSGTFPWPKTSGNFRKLMVAQDTGSAIVGPGRGDIFCGSGPDAGDLAGQLRHTVDLFVLAPRLSS